MIFVTSYWVSCLIVLFADEEFSQFAQDIGLASLGAPSEYIRELAMVLYINIEEICINSLQNKYNGEKIDNLKKNVLRDKIYNFHFLF